MPNGTLIGPELALADPAASANNVPIDLSITFGALFVGLCIGLVLWGMQILQSFWYYLNYPNDPPLLKVWVLLLNLFATSDIAFSFAGIWQATIKSSGKIPDTFATKPVFYRIPMYGFVGFLAQLFFLYRIYKFASVGWVKILIPLTLLPMIVYQLVANIIFAVTWLCTDPGTDVAASALRVNSVTQKWVISSYAVASATDILITIVLSALLLSQRSGVQRTDRLLVRIAITSINTGSWTAVDALLTAILTATNPTNKLDYIYAAPSWVASTLYANTVLCNLNIRQFFRTKDSADSSSIKFASTLHTLRFLKPFRGSPPTSFPSHETESDEHELPTIRVEVGEEPLHRTWLISISIR